MVTARAFRGREKAGDLKVDCHGQAAVDGIVFLFVNPGSERRVKTQGNGAAS